jgi:hypothetical protein
MKVGCIGSEAGDLTLFKELVGAYPAHDFYLYLDTAHGAYAVHTDDENEAALLRACAWLEGKHADIVLCFGGSPALLGHFFSTHGIKVRDPREEEETLLDAQGGAGERVIHTTEEIESDELARHLGGHFIPGS